MSNRLPNSKSPHPVSPEDDVRVAMQRLEQTFSRGLATGWLEGVRPHELVSGKVVSHRGTRLGTVVEVRRDAAVVALIAPVRCGDGVFFENTDDPEHAQGGRVYEIIRRRESVKEAESGAKVLLTFANNSIDDRYVAENQTVWKTDDPRRQREIQKTWKTSQPNRRVPLNINVRAEVGKPIEICVTNKLGANICLAGTDNLEPARKHLLSLEMLREQLDRLGGTIYSLGNVEAEIVGNPMVPLSVLGNLRREMLAQLDEYSFDGKSYTMIEHSLESIRRENSVRWLPEIRKRLPNNGESISIKPPNKMNGNERKKYAESGNPEN